MDELKNFSNDMQNDCCTDAKSSKHTIAAEDASTTYPGRCGSTSVVVEDGDTTYDAFARISTI